MVSGAVDNNVMIWTSPFDGQQGEVIEGVENSNMPKARESHRNSQTFIKKSTESGAGSIYMEGANGNTNANDDEFYQNDPQVHVPTQLPAQQIKEGEIYEKEMKVIDKVMDTLNSVVCQLDIMNTNMKQLESRIDNLELETN